MGKDFLYRNLKSSIDNQKKVLGLSIAVDCSNISSDGAVALNDGLIEEIASSHSVGTMVYLFCNNEYTPSISVENFEIVRINHSNRISHFLWNIFVLNKLLRRLNCNHLYLLGGYYLGVFRPYSALFQNLLPFETEIVKRYPFWVRRKLFLLSRFYKYSFQNAEKPYFLTKHTTKYFDDKISSAAEPSFIPFRIVVKTNSKLASVTKHSSMRFLYVANITEYKNHKRLVQAFSIAYKKNPEVKLTLIGRMVGKESNRILEDIFSIESSKEFLSFDGYIPREKIGEYYESHICLIFPSLVESLGVPLYEAMLYDLQILCSDKISLVPILELGKTDSSRFGKFGYTNEIDDNKSAYKKVNYFDSYSVESIVKSIEEFIT